MVRTSLEIDEAQLAERLVGGFEPRYPYAEHRCLIGLARPTEAAPVLQHAREIFDRLGAAPSLAETDELLARATARSS